MRKALILMIKFFQQKIIVFVSFANTKNYVHYLSTWTIKMKPYLDEIYKKQPLKN